MKIKDKDSLIRIFQAISWLDAQRWNNESNYNLINFFRDDLTNCEKILTHWICYITDRQKPFETVWDNGGQVFSELVHQYSNNIQKQPKEILDEHYEEYQDEKGKQRFRFKSIDNKNFASRFVTDDYQNILQTLELLNNPEYERNIIAYVAALLQRFKNQNDLLIRVAFGLHLLAYQLHKKKTNPEEIKKILENSNEFEKKLEEFKKTSTSDKKRLWCCVRDYKKGLYNEIFNNAIREVVPNNNAEEIINLWKSLPMEQIELPGDVWNNSPLFRNYLFANVLDFDSIPKTWEMPRIIREVYNQLKENNEIVGDVKDFYPEQFDITFDFVPKMCSKKLCNVCLFGRNGVDLICIPTRDKYCPVALLSCGYIAKCVENNCIIKKGISKKICKGS